MLGQRIPTAALKLTKRLAECGFATICRGVSTCVTQFSSAYHPEVHFFWVTENQLTFPMGRTPDPGRHSCFRAETIWGLVASATVTDWLQLLDAHFIGKQARYVLGQRSCHALTDLRLLQTRAAHWRRLNASSFCKCRRTPRRTIKIQRDP